MNKKHNTAFTLVELLLAMVILGVLMAAVAFAFDASITNYQANEGIYRTVNTGRQTLLRITNDVRTATWIATIGAGSDQDADDSELTLETSVGQNITYKFDSTTNELRLYTSSGNYLLCENINSITFNRATVSGDPDAIRNVRIVMTLTDPDSGVSHTLAAAAVVRRNLGN